ncbi:helix-turn-helix transcriptional regulator [Aminipila sp.]|uniref:helix-turn-helix transcriptional regulator n=1 Tax=Aminipila sp. TaxID=2060095 RepID=UPI00289D4961|nr:helix-turn-helix transcriptional regulator [Aminipila sp.]
MKTILKTIREKKGFTQVEVADKANIAIRTYQNYEAGERVPNVHTAISIAKALNTSIEVLFPVTVPDDFQSDN